MAAGNTETTSERMACIESHDTKDTIFTTRQLKANQACKRIRVKRSQSLETETIIRVELM